MKHDGLSETKALETKALNVLLVDDSPFDRAMVRRELRREFDLLEIHEATNEVEFMAALNAPEFDLVITDFQIRWTDGLKVFRAVKKQLPDCPVLMFTATGSEEIAVEAMKAGLDDYILKNVNHLVRLRAAVRATIEHSRTRIRAGQLASRLESLLSQLQVGVFRCQADGTITDANDASAVILGHAHAHELSGRKLADYVVDRTPTTTMLSRTAPTNDGDSVKEFEATATRADGKPVWLAVSERKGRGESGESVIEGLVEDITARKNAEDELQRIQDEMAHVSRINIMSELAAGISHELNQPLGAIANYAAVCLIKLQDVTNHDISETVSHIEEIREMAHFSGDIIRSLREFVRRAPRELRPVEIRQLIRSAVDIVQFEIRRHGISVDLNLCSSDVCVIADPVQIRQVLLNLISNAIDAMVTEVSENRIVSVTATPDEGHIRVLVSDCGPGISDEQFDQLFEPFVSGKPNGTGIGLSISTRIIKAHRGSLKAWNNETVGATFEFTLPLAEGTQP